MKDIDKSSRTTSVLSREMQFIRSRMVMVRDRPSLLMGDVARLYGVEPREVGQAVKNNPMKFPEGYVFDLTKEETDALKSKILILENASGRGRHSKRGNKVFTEQGLYMLATILKGERAARASLAIVETYVQVRGLKRELLAMHTEADAKKRNAMMQHFGRTLVDIVMPDPDSTETETSLELNFFIGKLKHTVRRVRKAGART